MCGKHHGVNKLYSFVKRVLVVSMPVFWSTICHDVTKSSVTMTTHCDLFTWNYLEPVNQGGGQLRHYLEHFARAGQIHHYLESCDL